MFVVSIVLLLLCLLFLEQINRFCPLTLAVKKIKTIDGASLDKYVAISYKRFWGNTFDLLSKNIEETFYYNRSYANKFKRNYIQKYMYYLIYNIIDPMDAELVLRDSRAITKGFVYNYLQSFLKTGLLTSTGHKWHNRRRLLTPAFHFKLLPKFVDTFKSESLQFVNNLKENLMRNNNAEIISLSEIIPRLTLNIICEAAMGVKLENCLDGDEYRRSIKEVEEVVVKRIQNPIFVFYWLYFMLKDGRNALKSMQKMHKFSSGIIEKRRILAEKNLDIVKKVSEQPNEDGVYRKKHYAMLDTLLMAEKCGLIDHAGICEEVDTVIFEGFDTTSMNLIFALMNLANFTETQQKCYEEIQEHIQDDFGNLNVDQLSNLKYLDCVIKETQRLYPSVPLLIRKCVSDLPLDNNLILPKGTQINIHTFDLQRNPKYFQNPDEFQPERFLAEGLEKRHPFAFIPFSAGQRNCIGQKFAMLEIKTLLVYVLKNFQLKSVTKPESIRFSAGLLLRTNTDVQIKIYKRCEIKI